MTEKLAKRAEKAIRLLLDGSGYACSECHCAECLRDHPHKCTTTKLLDDLARASGRQRKGGRS